MRAHTMTALAAGLLMATGAWAQPREAFAIGGQRVAAGERLDLDLQIPAGTSDPATRIPVTVFHGASDGPVLALTAGVHGYEFPPILAAQALLDRIDPARLRGTVILVRIANVEAFEQRVPYVNPFDRQNLNRSFPGRSDGTPTERIAWALTGAPALRRPANASVSFELSHAAR
ncbi:MAG: succinylglutamate desuccinylase/aspartoacylase family protein [Vicinamibacterales bacterium]|nr:succinylglutamate desuccinylase/aspartoacylase family protein [Vicinamibacterales bacterium]